MASMSGRLVAAAAVVAAALSMTHRPAGCAENGAAPKAGGMTVLNNDSYLRTYLVFRTPVCIAKDGAIKVPLEPVGKDPKPLENYQSPPPPDGWTKSGFDDSSWDRQNPPVEMAPGSATGHSQAARYTAAPNSMICLRWKFVVEDPAGAQDLRLSLEYVGGAAVYVNGQELVRAHLPAGELKVEALAEKYPDDLHCEAGGAYLQDPSKNPAGFERRYRKLSDVVVPGKLLVKGANILAVQIHRAPINEAAIAARRSARPGSGMGTVPGMWAYAGLKSISLIAADGGVTPNTGRPKGIQAWNVASCGTVTVFDYGDPGDPLPVQIAAARNGTFSGRLVVSSDEAIKGLRVQVSELTRAGGGSTDRIPAAAVRVRCAGPAVAGKSWAPSYRFDGLFDIIPAEIPVAKVAPPKDRRPFESGKSSYNCGALAPLWFTVRVPKDARPGRYEGSIAITAQGLKPTTVPLRVDVFDWSMPDPKDFRIHNFAYLSEDALAKHYGVPLWSDKHLELMGKSLELMAEINSRQAIVNLAINFYSDNRADCSNEQSLVRWIRQPDGSFKHDFSVFDKYLDLVAKTIGRPTLLRVNCWPQIKMKDGRMTRDDMPVTLLDPATGKLEPMDQPMPGTEESFNFWKPVLDEARRKITARGWWDATAIGHNSYCYPPDSRVVDVCRKIWPDGTWSYTAHNGTLGMRFAASEKGVFMPVRHADAVWTAGPAVSRGYRALLKPRPGFWCYTFRNGFSEASDLTVLRDIPESEIMRGHDGLSDFGADLFPVKAANGRFYCVGNGRGTGGPACSTRALLAPGDDGAIATERFEMLREGVEIGEALIFLQRAIEEKKIGGDLEQKANRLLDERSEAFMRRWGAVRFGWDARLLALAGEVAAAGGQ